MKQPIILSEGRMVEIVDDWRIHIAAESPVLRGIYSVGGHDYFRDGRPLAPSSPRIVKTVNL